MSVQMTPLHRVSDFTLLFSLLNFCFTFSFALTFNKQVCVDCCCESVKFLQCWINTAVNKKTSRLVFSSFWLFSRLMIKCYCKLWTC